MRFRVLLNPFERRRMRLFPLEQGLRHWLFYQLLANRVRLRALPKEELPIGALERVQLRELL